MVIMFTIIIGVACLLIGFALGRNEMIADRISQAVLNRDLDGANQRLERLEAELVDARLNVDVQRAATNALRQDLTKGHAELGRLQEEVTFYKGLMSPSSLAKGLQVAELDVVPMPGTRDFGYQLLLTQVALRRSFIAGDVRIDVIGQWLDGNSAINPDAGLSGISATNLGVKDDVVLSLTELAELKTYPFKFRFRYFQDLAGQMTLPDGFVPERVLVTAHQNGKEALQVTFPWPADAIHEMDTLSLR